MVRKRSRTSRRSYRKLYDSDESESDSDLELDSPPASPAPKRYGLRQRKQPVFRQDFDYDDEDELNDNRRGSDDEEYDVEVDLVEVKENNVSRSNKTYPKQLTAHSSDVSLDRVKPEVEEVSISNINDGLIDFEDVIRADVVVNKQKVDYDNVINKTEIQVESIDNSAQCRVPVKEKADKVLYAIRIVKPNIMVLVVNIIKPGEAEFDNMTSTINNYNILLKNKGRRGRKPKAKFQLSEPYSVAEDIATYSVQNSCEEDTNLEVQIDPLNFVQCDSDESNPPKSNGVRPEKFDEHSISSVETLDSPVENGSSTIKIGHSVVDDIEKYVPPQLDEKEKQVVLSNEYLLGNSFDMTADEFLEKQASKKEELQEEEEVVPFINFDDDSNSSDDVVIIEKKPEIIVLDDD